VNKSNINKIIIVGGGTAGWMTAAMLAKRLDTSLTKIVLVESDDIGTVGVGEATLPHIRLFNQTLGIDERDFMRKTKATYKLGIQLVNWAQIGDDYIHPFGDYGERFNDIPFQNYWLKARSLGDNSNFEDYSLAVLLAKANKFTFPSNSYSSALSRFSYAYHIDAGLYAKYLREYSENKGVTRIEGEVSKVKQNQETGFIESIEVITDKQSDSKQSLNIDGQLFIDCSGFRGVLIEQVLHTGYQDWSEHLPCNSAVAVGCESNKKIIPYSRASAKEAGWQWRIPLQHRTGNGYVYCNKFIDDEQAKESLLANLDAPVIGEPIQLRFTTGKRNKVWNKNCVAIGLSSGFLEPLESTSIFLIQDTITKLMDNFPNSDFAPHGIAEFNRMIDKQYERIRDFLILHYHATQRSDSPFWEYVKNKPIPDSLAHKIALFKQQGHVPYYSDGLFYEPSWLAVFIGQRIIPENFHQRLDNIPTAALLKKLDSMRFELNKIVNNIPSHEQTLADYLRADSNLLNTSPARNGLYGLRL
jgi:tryptophan halogenase